MRFSLIHPSRGRVARAGEAIREWRAAASRPDHEYVLSVDDDDADRGGYAALAEQEQVRFAVHRNRSIVDAVNHAAALSHGDVLIVVSDDFGCPPQWDRALAAAIGNRTDVAVLVNDGVDGRIMTLPIVDRAYYESCGYIYYPDYISMYCDDDLTEYARQTGRLIDARHLTFPHRRPAAAAYDATYRRQDRGLAWIEGRRVLARRRLTRFSDGPVSAAIALRLLRIDVTCSASATRRPRISCAATCSIRSRPPTPTVLPEKTRGGVRSRGIITCPSTSTIASTTAGRGARRTRCASTTSASKACRRPMARDRTTRSLVTSRATATWANGW